MQSELFVLDRSARYHEKDDKDAEQTSHAVATKSMIESFKLVEWRCHGGSCFNNEPERRINIPDVIGTHKNPAQEKSLGSAVRPRDILCRRVLQNAIGDGSGVGSIDPPNLFRDRDAARVWWYLKAVESL